MIGRVIHPSLVASLLIDPMHQVNACQGRLLKTLSSWSQQKEWLLRKGSILAWALSCCCLGCLDNILIFLCSIESARVHSLSHGCVTNHLSSLPRTEYRMALIENASRLWPMLQENSLPKSALPWKLFLPPYALQIEALWYYWEFLGNFKAKSMLLNAPRWLLLSING